MEKEIYILLIFLPSVSIMYEGAITSKHFFCHYLKQCEIQKVYAPNKRASGYIKQIEWIEQKGQTHTIIGYSQVLS